MALHRIQKGLDLPLEGEPRQEIAGRAPVARVALVADDYVGMRPALRVEAGDKVRRGQILFEDKKTPGVFYTAPGAGELIAVNRGHRRALQTVVIELTESERNGEPTSEDLQAFQHYSGKPAADYDADAARALLLESGMWPALRARPFGRVADPQAAPHSIFITAIDTDPHAPRVDQALAGREGDFSSGLEVLLKLTQGPVFLCKAPDTDLPTPDDSRLRIEEFQGPHPAGLPGLHIHMLDAVHRNKTVWHIGYPDVAAVGALFRTGVLDVDRVVSLAGPAVAEPCLLRTRLGASTDDIVRGRLRDADSRVVAGSVLGGRTALGGVTGFLGRYHRQVAALHEGSEREFIGWMLPGAGKFSTVRAFVSGFLGRRRYAMSTSTHGSPRAMLPIGQYERVMAMDMEATYLLRAILAGDIEKAIQLGCLELDEEDLALCTFVCPGKNDYGPALREMLTTIEKEG